MILLSSMKNKYKGKPAAILGGGPSLPDDIKLLPKNCLLIAVNYHALYYCKPTYMVYNDTPDTNPLQQKAVDEHTTIHVSPDPTSDVKFDVPDVWTGFFSSNTAAWFALFMGCNPVILCGMDCYQGDQVYFHEYDRDYDPPCWHYPVEDHIRPWREDGKHLLPHVERVRVMSGPLGRVFPMYEGEAK